MEFLGGVVEPLLLGNGVVRSPSRVLVVDHHVSHVIVPDHLIGIDA